MKANVQFLEIDRTIKKVLPIGEGFFQKEQMYQLQGEASIKHLNKTISDFHKSIRDVSRKSRAETPFICKAKYILATKNRFLAKEEAVEELISLLADSCTLFSFDYQQYMTDHAFFLDYSKVHGKSEKEKLQFCRNKALQNVPEDRREYYEEILKRFQENMENKKLSAEEVEEKLASDLVPRKISQEELCDFLSWCRRASAESSVNVSREIQDNYPELDLTPEETEKLVNDYLTLLLEDKSLGQNFLQKFLAYYFLHISCEKEYSSTAYNVLNRWIPGIKIDRDEAGRFVTEVLKTYLFYCKDICIVKAACGHYRRTYRVYEKDARKHYLENKKTLSNVVKKNNDWIAEDLSSVIDSILNYTIFSENCAPKIPLAVGPIYSLTTEYLGSTRSGAEHFDSSYAKSVIWGLYTLEKEDFQRFPFLYLMVCVAGTSQLFSSERTLSGESIVAAIKNPYFQKPSRAKQRISRIRFLNGLNKVCDLDRVAKTQNWNLFLQVHGSVIESPEEAALWKEIIYGDTACKKSPQEDIPPIELALLCDCFLQDCLPVQEQFLYCYCGGSYVQEGGYARFLKEYPCVLDECTKRIGHNTKKWGYPEKVYLKLWSGISCDVHQIKDLCTGISSHIRWESIPYASHQALTSFLIEADHYGTSMAGKDKIERDIENLRILLVETSLRKILTKEATDVLRNNVEEGFNRKTNFPIGLSKLLGQINPKGGNPNSRVL